MHRALVFLATGFEEMEAVITIDVLRRANVEVVTAALGAITTVTGSHDISIEADAILGDLSLETDAFDLVVLPGGMPGSVNLRDDARVAAWVREQIQKERWVAAICAAPVALAHFEALVGKSFTSYPAFREQLSDANGVYLEQRVVVDGKLITSRGPGTAFEFALTLVEHLVNSDTASALAASMLVTR